ncbi:MAG: hypothetical protein AB8C13_09035 [Phycisphaerales bacterium]
MDTTIEHDDRRSINWHAVRTHCGVFIIGILGFFVIQSKTMLAVNDPNIGFDPPSPRATIVGRIDPGSDQLYFERGDKSGFIQIDRGEYCQQAATAVLVRFNHKITDDEIVFMRNPRLPGNAIQQFSKAFGYAIETGLGSESPN